MEIKEFLSLLNLNIEPEMKDGKYIVTLDNSDYFANVYSRLDKKEDVDLVDLEMSEQETVATYMSDDFDITLSADYDNDVYQLVIEESKE